MKKAVTRVVDSLLLRWFCRVYFQIVPTKATLICWTHTLRPQTLHQLNDRVVKLTIVKCQPFSPLARIVLAGSSGE